MESRLGVCIILSRDKLYNQIFFVEEPVPSLPLTSLKFKDGKWYYAYTFETPVRLIEGRVRKYPLFVDGAIHGLRLINEDKRYMTNIPIYSKEDIYHLLDLQREADYRFRDEFILNNLDRLDDFNEMTFTLRNKSQKATNKAIVRIKKQDDMFTTFVGRTLK